MLTALLLILSAAPVLTEVPVMSGWTISETLGMSPAGEVLVHAWRDDGMVDGDFLLRNGRFSKIQVRDSQKFGVDPDAFRRMEIEGYLPDERFYFGTFP